MDNPTCFLNPFQFEITFECLQELEDGTLAVGRSIATGFLDSMPIRLFSSSFLTVILFLAFEIDLEWKVLYVGSAHDSHQDQVLDEILVGPVPVGLNKFVLQADPPDPAKLPPDEVLGVTVVLVTCSYREKEFVRVGFYVNNEYLHPDYIGTATTQQPPAVDAPALGNGDGESGAMDATTTENPANAPAAGDAAPAAEKPLPVYPDLEMTYVQRHILADKPRITKFPISWGNEPVAAADTTMMVTNDDDRIMAPTPSPLGAEQSPAAPLSPMTTSMDVLMEG